MKVHFSTAVVLWKPWAGRFWDLKHAKSSPSQQFQQENRGPHGFYRQSLQWGALLQKLGALLLLIGNTSVLIWSDVAITASDVAFIASTVAFLPSTTAF